MLVVSSVSLWPHGLSSARFLWSTGILQARMLEEVAIPFSRGSSWPGDQTPTSCTAGRFFTVWATRRLWGQVNMLSKDYYAIHIKRALWNTHFGICRWYRLTSVFSTAPGIKVGTLKDTLKTRQQWSGMKGQMDFSQCCLPGGSEKTITLDGQIHKRHLSGYTVCY